MRYVNEDLLKKAEQLKEESGSEAAYQFLMNILKLELKDN